LRQVVGLGVQHDVGVVKIPDLILAAERQQIIARRGCVVDARIVLASARVKRRLATIAACYNPLKAEA